VPDSLWNRVRELEGKELHTLGQRKEFKLVSVDERQAELRLRSTGGRALVRRNFLEPMWEDLLRERRLILADWQVTTTLPGRSWVTKYAAPILAQLEEVKVVGEGVDRALVLVISGPDS
jgi:hypothetical protein